MIFQRKYHLLLGAALILGTAACTPTISQRGNMLEDYQIEKVEIGTHSKSDVLRLVGSPTTVAPFNEDIWYYIGQETKKRGILDPKVTDERIVAIAFNQEGFVEQISDVDQGRINIPITRDKTPTHGNETTMVQELFGNLGKFNPPVGNESAATGGN